MYSRLTQTESQGHGAKQEPGVGPAAHSVDHLLDHLLDHPLGVEVEPASLQLLAGKVQEALIQLMLLQHGCRTQLLCTGQL